MLFWDLFFSVHQVSQLWLMKTRKSFSPVGALSYSSLEILCLSLVGFHPHICGFVFSKRIKGLPVQISGAHPLPTSFLFGTLSCRFQLPQSALLVFLLPVPWSRMCLQSESWGSWRPASFVCVIPYLKDHSSMLSVVQFWKEYSGRASLGSFLHLICLKI